MAGRTDDLTAQIRQQQPAVVINTIGPFTTTAPPIIQACLAASSDYLDLANDVAAVAALLAQNEAATAAGRTIVTGAGFGVTATESVVVKLTQRPAQHHSSPPPPASGWTWCPPSHPKQARSAPPWPEPSWKACPVSTAVAVSRAGVTRTAAWSRPGSAARCPTSPCRTVRRVTTAAMPLGELIAAQRASGAPDVVVRLQRGAVGAGHPGASCRWPWRCWQIAPVRAFATNRLARVQLKAHDRPREHSYGHAVIQWPDGTTREGWLQLGDAQAFTGAVPAEIARRLLAGQGRPGAYTPAALFGPSLAEACGARYLTTPARPPRTRNVYDRTVVEP